MFLALKEMRRALVRFGLLIGAVALLAFLILFQQALRDGLLISFVGGIRNQRAPVLVYSVDAQRTLEGSVITPPLEAQIRATPGIDTVARVGQNTFTVQVEGGDDDSDAAIIGTDDPSLVRPVDLTVGRLPATPGEAVGSDTDFAVGDEVEVVATVGEPVRLTVVGVARDIQLSVSPTLFTDLATFEAATRAASPDAGDILPSALAIRPVDGTAADDLVAAINSGAPDAEALTREDAADRSPGVSQVRQSFQVIFVLYGVVIPLVTGLFFLILTLQKAGALTLLRAVGVAGGALARALLVQVAVVLAAGLAVGIALYAAITRVRVGGLALRFDAGAVALWSVLLVVLGLFSVVVSLRRVLRIDPIEATTGAAR